jgi:hypothetical protein
LSTQTPCYFLLLILIVVFVSDIPVGARRSAIVFVSYTLALARLGEIEFAIRVVEGLRSLRGRSLRRGYFVIIRTSIAVAATEGVSRAVRICVLE